MSATQKEKGRGKAEELCHKGFVRVTDVCLSLKEMERKVKEN